MQHKMINIRGSQIEKLDEMGAGFGRKNEATGDVNHSGLIRDLIEREYAYLADQPIEPYCVSCDWKHEAPNEICPLKCPKCGSTIRYRFFEWGD